MAKILIVDDEPLNRELVHAYLEGSGHEVLDAASAEAAVELARLAHPDLILLDVMLPGMSGFDAVPHLKQQAGTDFLPVILVTALNDQPARVRGLRAGADEFLTKPLERNELLVRVQNLLALRHKDQALAQRNRELAQLHKFRDEVTAMIVHDLKNPMSALKANLDYAMTELHDETSRQEALVDSMIATDRTIRLIGNLLEVTQLETGHLTLRRTHAPVAGLVEPIIGERTHLTRARAITVSQSIPDGLTVHADVELIIRVFENVLDNAIRYTPPGGRIVVLGSAAPRSVTLKVGNTGTPIPPAARAQIFEKFGQSGEAQGRMNIGLGLYFCRLAAEAHGGRIWVEEDPALPTVFGIELPS